MTVGSFPEFWLRGPIDGIPPVLQPVAHSLLQTREDASRAAESLSVDELWDRPAGCASAGFHLRHMAGVLDRLFTYARGEGLDEERLAYLRTEADPGRPPADAGALVQRMQRSIDQALEELRGIGEDTLLLPRKVGRQELPSNVLGLIFHAAEHTQRHTGQLIVTARVVSGRGEVSQG
ncbi:MAG: DinB family protein [Gemmatimonadetes bacterium]|nr:DinB family protein [Gemmatimonadota bacterium]